jgi:hypothetical protein
MQLDSLKRLNLVVNAKTVIISLLAGLATWISLHFGIIADFPLTIISTAVIFPIVFSIGNAYKRRESALNDYGVIKAHGRALYFAARDWFPEKDDIRLRQIEQAMAALLHACRDLFKSPRSDMDAHERSVYAAFSKLSNFVKDLRDDGLAATECSRCNQYITKMVVSFERIKHIYQYRTPQSLRAFSDFFILVLPIIYGPYFAYLAVEYKAASMTYVMPVLFAVILTGLDNIQTHLEDPFDQIGADDVSINAEKFVELLSCGEDDETCIGAQKLQTYLHQAITKADSPAAA